MSFRPSTCQRPVSPGRHVEAARGPAGDLVRLVDDERARADEAHLALEHVPELRELVEARASQEAADARHARVDTLDLEQRAVDLVHVQDLAAPLLRADGHRPELDDLERRAETAAARLPVERRALAVDADHAVAIAREHGRTAGAAPDRRRARPSSASARARCAPGASAAASRPACPRCRRAWSAR